MWLQTVNTLIFVFGVFFGVLAAIHLANVWKQKMPSHTRLAHEQFAKIAVQATEQQSSTLSGQAKKQFALAAVTKLTRAYDLPALPADALDITLESAVYEHLSTEEEKNA